MKIRTGFVSNSSSASFIIGIPINKKWGNFTYTLKQFVKLFRGSLVITNGNKTIDKYSIEDVAKIIYGMIEGTYCENCVSIGNPKLLEYLTFLNEHDNDPEVKKLTKKMKDIDIDEAVGNYDIISQERDVVRMKLAISIMETMPKNYKYYILTTGDQSPFRNWMCHNVKHHIVIFKNVYFRWLG